MLPYDSWPYLTASQRAKHSSNILQLPTAPKLGWGRRAADLALAALPPYSVRLFELNKRVLSCR
jgi:hypothetical protein